MTSRCHLLYAGTGTPVDREPTPEEGALARTLSLHGHEWATGSYLLHDHEHGGEYHEHPMDELEALAENSEAVFLFPDGHA